MKNSISQDQSITLTHTEGTELRQDAAVSQIDVSDLSATGRSNTEQASAKVDDKAERRALKEAKIQEKRALNNQNKTDKQAQKEKQKEQDALAAEVKREFKQKQKETEGSSDESGANEREWFKIDNAALIFVPSRNRNWTNQFRLSCVMRQPIRPEILQQAVNDLFERFPTMIVYLRSGFFWNYFERAQKPPTVREEKTYPCRPFDVKARSYLLRIMYSGYRITVEFFHGITDGNGGSVYLLSLIKRYLELCGTEVPVYTSCFDHRDLPSNAEKEDAFSRFAVKGKRKAWGEKKSLQIKNARADRNMYFVTHASMSATQVKAIAHRYGATVSQYLSACLMWALRNEYLSTRTKLSDLPLKLCVPVDLRRIHKSETLRNFILMYNVEHYPEVDATFEDVVMETKQQFAMITPEYVQCFINKNVATAQNPFVRALPRPIKSFGLNLAYSMFGLRQSAMSFSNLGVIPMSPEMKNEIQRLEFVLGPGKVRGVKASCLTLGDELLLSFGSDCLNHNVESFFLTFLTQQGIDVTVDTNRRECNE